MYDALEADRPDLDAYVALAEETGAQRVLDIGCGTGSLALLLADRGIRVVGVDPARASVDVARRKPGADQVRWVDGDARALPALEVDLVTMTGNVAQAIVEPADWSATLAAAGRVLPPGGVLAFETRVPTRRAWEEWTRAATYQVVDVPGAGPVEHWFDVVDVRLPLVTFRGWWIFAADGERLGSLSTLRFREREEIEADLVAHGFVVPEVRDAPDRPGLEWVFVARRAP